MTLNTFEALIKKQNLPINFHHCDYSDFRKVSEGSSRWLFLSREPLGLGTPFEHQKKTIETLAKKTAIPYELPTVLEATVSILTYFVRSQTQLYDDMYMRCQESDTVSDNPMAVGFVSNAEFASGFVSDVELSSSDAEFQIANSADENSDCDGIGAAWTLPQNSDSSTPR